MLTFIKNSFLGPETPDYVSVDKSLQSLSGLEVPVITLKSKLFRVYFYSFW
jgi:hypothetical protein